MIADLKISEFLNELKSEAPTPGGGGVASLSSANGAALIMMVANLTVTVEKYAEWHEQCRAVLAETQKLLDVFVAGIDADAEEFGKVIAAYGLPRSTEEEKAMRSQAIGEASVTAAEAPLKIMEASVRALELDQSLLGRSNPNLKSDLLVAAQCLRTGLVSAKYNVDANIGGIRKVRPEYAEEMNDRAAALQAKGLKIAEEIRM